MKNSIEIVPTIKPTYKQSLVWSLWWDKITSFILFGGGAGGGKTWEGCEILLYCCYRFPGSKWFIGRRELNTLYKTTLLTWRKVCKFHSIPDSDWILNQKYHYIEFIHGVAKGSRIDLLECADKPSDPDFERFGSLEYTGGWLEEAGEISFKAFDVLKARIGRHMNKEFGLMPKLLLTCNPTQNWLYRIFYKPWKEKTLPNDYAFIRSLYRDNPHTADTYEKQLNSITDPNTKARLRDGVWEYTTDDLTLISYEAILDMFSNQIDADNRRYMTADIARFGGDKIVYTNWQGWELYSYQTKDKQSTVTTEQDIRDISVREGIPYGRIVVDEDGMGGGVVDHLEGVLGFMGGRQPISKPNEGVLVEDDENDKEIKVKFKKNYKNLRSQCYFMLAEKINKRQIKISARIPEKDREELIADLQQVRRKDNGFDAPLQIVPKEEMKDALGRSPDGGDSLMMRMYFELIVDSTATKYYPPTQQQLADYGVDINRPYGGIGFE